MESERAVVEPLVMSPPCELLLGPLTSCLRMALAERISAPASDVTGAVAVLIQVQHRPCQSAATPRLSYPDRQLAVCPRLAAHGLDASPRERQHPRYCHIPNRWCANVLCHAGHSSRSVSACDLLTVQCEHSTGTTRSLGAHDAVDSHWSARRLIQQASTRLMAVFDELEERRPQCYGTLGSDPPPAPISKISRHRTPASYDHSSRRSLSWGG
jgi:hypothetical protein